MAATIGHLAVLISAQTAPLQKDMNKAAKIAGDGARQMKDEVSRQGSLWGSFFRGAFALAMFKRMVREIEHGAEILRKANDPDSKAVDAHLKRYHDGLNQFAAMMAKVVSPILGEIGDMLNRTAKELQDIIDIADAVSSKGNTLDNLNRIQDERKAKQRLLREEKFANAEKNAAMKLFMDRAARIKPLFDELESPLEKHLKLIKEIKSLVMDEGQAAKMIANETEKLIKALNLTPEMSAFERYSTAVQDIESLRRTNLIDEYQMMQMLGQQVEKLAASQKDLAEANKSPEALMRGSAAAFSAINAFQRGKPQADAAKVAAEAAARAQEQRAEQIRLGKEIAQSTRKFANIEAMGP